MPDPIQEQDQAIEGITPGSTPVEFVPSTLFGGSPGQRLERLDIMERDEQENQRKANRSFGRKLYEATLEPALRGTTRALEETAQAVVGTGAFINKKLGIYKAFGVVGEDKFLSWYEQGEDRFNPFKFGDEFRDRHLGGPSDTLWEGLMETGVQFAVGFMGTGKLMAVAKLGSIGKLGTLVKGVGGVGKAGVSVKKALGGGTDFGALLKAAGQNPDKIDALKSLIVPSLKEVVYETVRGAATDVAVFDGHEQRLADLMEQHEILRNPIQQYLTTDMEDSEFEGRMKNALEGAMLGAQIDLILTGVRGFRAFSRAKTFAKRGDDILVTSEVDKWADELMGFEKARQAEIEPASRHGLQTVPEGERAAVSLLDDGSAELMVRLTDEERNLLPAGDASVDSNELMRMGGQRFEAAVKDPDSDFIGRGTTHGAAIEDIVNNRLGPDATRTEQLTLTDKLFVELSGELDGFVMRGQGDDTWISRAELGQRFADEQAEGITRMSFASPEEATQVGAALEMLDRARKMQRNADPKTGMDPETAAMFQEQAVAMEAAWKTGDMDTILRAQNNSNINLRPIYNAVQAKAAIATISEMFPRTVDVFTDKQLRKATSGLFPAEMDHDAVMTAMAEIFGTTIGLDAKVLGMRGYLIAAGREAQRTAALIEGVLPEAKSLHMARLTDQLDALLDLTDLVSGTGTNVARGLRAFGVKAGPRKLARGFPGIEQARANVEKAQADVEQIAKAGKDTSIVDRQLDEAMDQLEKIMGETTDEGIDQVRQAEVPSAETLPRGAAEAAGEAAPAPPAALTRDERILELTNRAEELVTTEASRESRLRKLEGLESPTAPEQARLSVRNMTHEEIDALARMIFLGDPDNPGEILQQILVPAVRDMAEDGRRFLQKPELTGTKKALKAAQWYRVNAMLSGPRTHAINTLSNTMTAISRPIEMAAGGVFYRNPETLRAARDLMVGLGQNWGDHWQAARRAMKMGQGVLDPKSSHFSGSYAAQQAAIRGGDGSLMVRTVGKPGTWLMGLDEFASQLNYRAHLRMGLMKQARRAGLAGDELAEWVERHLSFGYGRDGQGTIKQSIEFARENTFKAELGEAGQAFEALVTSETLPGEMLQVLMPFRKTPINITKYAWQRFPYLNLLSGNFRKALFGQAGAAAKEEAMGKFIIGNMMYGSAAMLFLNGSLTGDGPRDPRSRKLWLEAGNRPGTLRIGGTTIELRRLDPVLTPFVLVANLLETGSELDNETRGEAAAMLILTMAESVSERSFFSGLTEFFAATTQGNEDLLTRWMENTAQSMIPNILKQGNIDPSYREASTFIEELRSRTVGLSDSLEPRRNIFGEPAMKPVGLGQRAFNPMTMTFGDTVDQKLARELYDIGSTMVLPAEKKSFGEGGEIDLRVRGKYDRVGGGAKNQSPYDRWMELTASKEINGGRTLKARIQRLSETDTWKEADSPIRREIVENIITASRDAAWQTMLNEFPGLRQEVIFRKTMGQIKAVTTDEAQLQKIRDNFGMTEKGRFERLAARLRPKK